MNRSMPISLISLISLAFAVALQAHARDAGSSPLEIKSPDGKVVVRFALKDIGNQKACPNLMTVEGILGNEGVPSAVHNATLPFTRFLTGPGDYTYCWNSDRLEVTKAHQLALSTIVLSPR